MRARRSLLTATLTVLIVVGRGHTSPPPADRASRSGRTVILHPSEASFDIPTDWIAWYGKFHNNLHLSEKELALVKIGAGEWDTEYAKVVNSAMRFQDCVAHVGGEGWGKDGSSFADVQLRLFDPAQRGKSPSVGLGTGFRRCAEDQSERIAPLYGERRVLATNHHKVRSFLLRLWRHSTH